MVREPCHDTLEKEGKDGTVAKTGREKRKTISCERMGSFVCVYACM